MDHTRISIEYFGRSLHHIVNLGTDSEHICDEFLAGSTFQTPVAMRIDYSSHYEMDTEEGRAEWAHLIPPGGHMVYLDDELERGSINNDSLREPEQVTGRPYTVTLFHQFRCLDIIREAYVSLKELKPYTSNTSQRSGSTSGTTAEAALVRHCMNYLRQTILCHPNLRLEPAHNVVGTAIRGYDSTCRDWSKVYEAVKKNHCSNRIQVDDELNCLVNS